MQLDWLQSALVDLHRIRDYIRQYNPIAAQRIIACIEAATKNLPRFPEMGRHGEVAGTRELVITGLPYFVVYRVEGSRVQILRVLHDSQKWPPSM